MTTIVSASEDPILVAPPCQDTGLWKLDLDYEVLGRKYPDHFIAGVNEANAIFDLPNTWQSLLYHHALAGFPPKEIFLAAVRTGNYTTWPGLTTTLTLKHFSISDKMQKGHMKGQQRGVQLTKVLAPVTIKVEPGTANPPLLTITKHYDIFVVVYELLDTVHTDQTSPFPITSQQSYCYIMVGIHLDANYIFCELMKNQTKGKMVTAYQKNGRQDEALGTWAKTSPFAQRVFDSIQSMHFKERDDPRASSPGLPPLQHCQTGYPKV
jgi:hypothetical protein